MSMRKAPGLRLQTSIVQDNVPVQVFPGLFVGSIHAAFNVETLKSSKISHVLNLAGSYATFPEDFTYLSLSIRDKEYASLLSCLPVAAVFIDAGLKTGGVLIHCAGGRSRSPAVAMAFLMMKQQMSYSDVSAHVKTLRPVVSLNTGFEAQLKCLETAHGNVFVANQHLLKARLTRLTQLHENGELVNEVAKKRRQSQQTSSRSPPLLKKQSSIEMLASGCDDRGMIGERVPSGFCLSMPPASASGCSKETHGETLPSSFIPALRSMGTMFGCQQCGENLFCAGAIIHHHDLTKLTCQAHDAHNTRFLGALRGQTVADTEDNTASHISVRAEQVVATITKRPLLSKLRLRPHSPSVTMGNGSRTGDTSSSRRKSASSVLSMPNFDSESSQKGDEDSETGLPQPLQILQPARRPGTEESKRTSSVTLSPNKISGESRKKAGNGLWRSLTSFKSAKRGSKAATEDKRTHGQIQIRTGISELHKPAELASSRSEEAKSSEIGHTSEHLVFLKRNAMEWNRNIQQLVDISNNNSSQTSGASTGDQMAALLDEDSTILMTLNGCKQWFVDPQLWTIDQASARPEGEIRCPRETCGAIVGEWRWEGLRSDCGGSVAPAFVMKREAVCILGNMTSQSK
ncbi:hypothetical protein JG687_00012123 [Phytophthora cactorum]|uniref:protein-tyrosine-phosphatase n=1 Tax=Phytophthora cactorum TaxID=29920 RepID=A0A8T1U2U4_9STRA|nr:hypothetical protein PC120_g14794 [Phytophthora cactorum]KAG3055177.1 hypothetical protein PC121_g15923 [Phytophthora cactorum]KAG3166085.1 hypothetical protein PC128_g19790 [Phytophthora cactorum]KAG6953914.1 hypothetical protein JG687_00012123 [Phytophthora cactorum]